MPFCIIVNPNAGRKKGLAESRHLQDALDRQGTEYDTFISEAPGQDMELARRINPSAYEGIIVVGGDGTLFEVLNGLFAERDRLEIPLGVIPVGTGNSFIRDLNITDRQQAVDAILSGRTRDVDLGTFTCSDGRFCFINLLGAGFVSNVAHRALRYKRLGALSYVAGVLEELIVMKPVTVRLEIDGTVHRREVLFVEICNSRFTGGNMMMAPEASIDDGLFDIVLASPMSRIKLLRLFPSIFKGRHVEDPLIEVFRGASVKLKADRPMSLTPDGETFGTTPLEAGIQAGKIRMFCR